ncbi:MAG: TetR/AcrR family transcriptional regulator [Myxococcota bacterium]
MAHDEAPSRRRGRPLNEAQARRILDAAENAFAEAGYAGMRMQALSDSLGINKALPFHYYDSKQGLYDAVIERIENDLDDALELGDTGSGSALDTLHLLVDRYWTFLEGRPNFARLRQWGYLAGEGHDDAVQRRNKKRLAMFFRIVVEAVDGDKARAQQGYLSLVGAILFYWINPRAMSMVLGRKHDTKPALARRREHLHELVDALVSGAGHSPK